MIWLIWGRRAYGRVDAHGGEHAHTIFFHLWYMPLFAITSVWSPGPRRAFVTRLNRRSILATYARMWGPVAALGCFLGGTVPSIVAGGAFAALSVYAWSARGVRDRRRSDFNLLAFNTRCEARLLTAEVRGALRQSLDQDWQRIGTGRSPDEAAQRGVRSLEEAVLAYGLLRIDAIEHPGSGALADRILTGTYDAPPEGDGPYRKDHAVPIPNMVIEQAEAAVVARQPDRAPGIASQTPWWTFSANLLAVTAVLGAIALAIIVNRASTLHGPRAMTADQIAAGFDNNAWVTVRCDQVESLGAIDKDEAKYSCELGTTSLVVIAGSRVFPHNSVTGTLSVDRRGDTLGTLQERSIVFVQALVIVSIAYECFFAALIGFWITRRFRKRPSL